MSKLPAPVQRSRSGHVAMEIAEAAYRDYSRRYGTRQSLERLLQRGGFGWSELVVHLYSELAGTNLQHEELVEEDGT